MTNAFSHARILMLTQQLAPDPTSAKAQLKNISFLKIPAPS
ncbi:hypothetical protein [Sphingobacterium sp. InxBP1]|nr:hypothetical protein [Sphingobacterium sp. InxBP1]